MPKTQRYSGKGFFGLLQRLRTWLSFTPSLPVEKPSSEAEKEIVPDASEASSQGRRSVSSPTGPPFSTFDLPEPILQGIRDAGFERCTPIQERCLPLSLKGRDVAGQAQTGTGKTAAFLITVFDRLLRLEKKKLSAPSALIIAPTRELALQIYHDAQVLGGRTGLRVAAVFGGVGYEKQARQLTEGVDVVIGTPGRLIDYMKQKILLTNGIRMLVIDEADRMFDMGFIRDLRFMLKRLPPYQKRQSMLFSATLNYRVLELAYEYMKAPEEIYIEPQQRTLDTVDQSVFHVGMDEKLSLLLGILKRESWERVLIFSNTKAGVEFLSAKLAGNGYPAEGITGDLIQTKRLRLMERFKSGKLKILVATDVASRGIHVEDISHVINYDVPQDREDYVHRIGRTARVGKTGKAITLADEKLVWHLDPIEAYIGKKIPVVWFDKSWLEEDRAPVRRGRSRSAYGRKSRRETPARRSARPRPAPSKSASAANSPSTGPTKRRPRRRRKKPASESQASTPKEGT